MIKEIQYAGYTTEPSDYDCPDGQLAASLNLVSEDNQLKPVFPPSVILTLKDGEGVCYTHNVKDGVRYIVRTMSGFYCYGVEKAIYTLADGEEFVDISSIGNILVLSTSQHIHYILFKDGGYVYLGTELPKVEMRFALNAEVAAYERDAGLTLTDHTSAEETYELVKTVTVDTTTKTGVIYKIDCGLEADTEYKFEYPVELKSHIGYATTYIYGIREGGSEYELLFTWPAKKHRLFRTAEKYKQLGITCYTIIPIEGEWFYGKLKINISKGFSSSVSFNVVEYTSANYQALFAAVNKFVSDYGRKRNRFVFPFFVRYAVRLLDGTYARVSDPVLLIPNSGYAPLISYKADGNKSDKVTLYAFFADLQYAFSNGIDGKWRDIVAGVDIFVSPQTYPYSQGQAFDASKPLMEYAYIDTKSGADTVKGTDYGFARLENYIKTTEGQVVVIKPYGMHDLSEKAGKVFGFGDSSRDLWTVVRIAGDDEAKTKLAETGTFRLVHSFDFDEIVASGDATIYENLPLEDGVLEELDAREALTDDMLANCSFLNARLTSYNQRLHLYDYHMRHPAPAAPFFQNGRAARAYKEPYAFYQLQTAYVYIRTSSGEKVVKKDFENNVYDTFFSWYYYPHTGAYKAMLVYTYNEKYSVVELKLRQHPVLNGAYWMAEEFGDEVAFPELADSYEPPVVDDATYYPASVIQSAVSAPYVFQAAMVNALGVRRILGMSSAAKALSQGQFGQFPLYAFTTDGVWALEVSSAGTYSARQPVTRDVCISQGSITQLDSSVLFATDRGIMLISGSQTQCITDSIFSEAPFNVLGLPGMDKLHAMLGDGHATDACVPVQPFIEFLKGCQMVYDYVHQRVIVFNPEQTTGDDGRTKPLYTYAYVYSLRSQRWGMTYSVLASTVNSYPDALAMTQDGRLVSFSGTEEAESRGLFVTRPLKLDAADAHKTISALIQRGHFERGDVATVLYGSRDLYNWRLVWSSRDHFLRGFRGTPYKYFRIAALTTLTNGKSVSGVSVSYELRHTGQLR